MFHNHEGGDRYHVKDVSCHGMSMLLL